MNPSLAKVIGILPWSVLLLALQGPAQIFAAEPACAHRIIFLPQYHDLDVNLARAQTSIAERDRAIASQLKIANYLAEHADVPVFSEQLARDYVWAELPAGDRANITRYMTSIIPAGLPQEASKLSELQRKELLFSGGELVQFMRQVIPAVHRVVPNQQVLDEVMTPIQAWFKAHPGTMQSYSPRISRVIFDEREKLALEQVNLYFAKNSKETQAILIYGANHSFSVHPESFAPECITVPESFKQDWLGKTRRQN